MIFLLVSGAVQPAAPAYAAGPATPQQTAVPVQSPVSRATDPGAAPAGRLAKQLLATIPSGSGLALRPLDPRETGLPASVGGQLYESVLNAVVRASRSRKVTVLARERLREVYGTLEEFHDGNLHSMLRAAKADIEIICKANTVVKRVRLSCSAVHLETTATLAHAIASFPLENAAAPLPIAASEIARRLAREAPRAGRVERTMLIEVPSGARGDLSALLERRLAGEIERTMAERARREARADRAAAVLATGPGKKEGAVRYRLEGDFWRLDGERIRIEARLRLRGRNVASAAAVIAVASLPRHVVTGGLAGTVGKVRPGPLHEAVAVATISPRLDRASAVRAARNLARARVVAQARDLPPPGVKEVTAEAEAVTAFAGFLDAGLPVDERFSEVRPKRDIGGADRVAVRLAARVVPIGRLVRPEVDASLDRAVYRAGEPMRIEIRSAQKAHLGVFAWGADNRVVRLYPRDPALLEIGAGETLRLPRPGERRILSAPLPLPRNNEDHEAFVVVASPRPIDFAALAAAAGTSLSGTMRSAVTGSGFLAALAAQDPDRMALIWLPYRVRN